MADEKDASDVLIDYFDDVWEAMDDTKLAPFVPELSSTVRNTIAARKQGDFPKWFWIVNGLPDLEVESVDLDSSAVTVVGEGTIYDELRALRPWRKGPFSLFGTEVRTEWQCSMKWDRLLPHLPSLENQRILDIGCGNGYYLLRMAAQNPRLLIGVEPVMLFLLQFMTVEKYAKSNAHILPIGVDDLPAEMNTFDLVFSMGVLYHRRDPIGHLFHMKKLLNYGGLLILETLIIEGEVNECLIPDDRYARMRNVWFLPSVKMMLVMLKRAGYKNVECVDVNVTTFEEQRTTDWTFTQSLADYLTPDGSKTLEGYPPPKRAIFKAYRGPKM